MAQKTEKSITAEKVTVPIRVRLTIKGTEHDLTEQEAREIKDLLCKLFGENAFEDFKKTLREIERKTDRDPAPYIPHNPLIPQWPPEDKPWWPKPNPWKYPEVWCGTSTDNQFRCSVESLA